LGWSVDLLIDHGTVRLFELIKPVETGSVQLGGRLLQALNPLLHEPIM
jgi:hypothetical protein